MYDFSVLPILETDRLILRKMTMDDKEDLFEMRSNPIMSEHNDTKAETDITETEAYIKKMLNGIENEQWLIWAVVEKISQKVIGSVSIWNFGETKSCAELGYGINPKYHRNGYMKEVLKSIIIFCFDELNFEYLDAYTEEKNIPSRSLLESFSFKNVSTVIDEGFYSKRNFNMVEYRLERP